MLRICCPLALALLAFAGTARAADQRQVEFFESKIRPMLVKHCYRCHSMEAKKEGKLKGGLVLDDRDSIRRGGDTGPAVVPGDVKKSLLLSALRHEKDLEMPPRNKLPDNVIADFAAWIKMGAPDPRDGKGVIQQAIDLDKGRQFWCFQPVRKPALPAVKDAEWSQSPVDRFLAAGLQAQGLKPVGEAAHATFVRRVYFDLIGLPPTPEQLKTWVELLEGAKPAEQDGVRAQLVDALLAQPQFGERWGRHWLDVARYAESNGNSRNATFPHAWRYRDYVIDAVNRDTPYDRFLLEQVAGDLLPGKNAAERNRNLVATGFLALGSKPVIRGKQAGFVPDIVADQIEVTSRAVLGLTVACARCHDHKFDPIPTADYYGLAGIFASSQTLYGGGGGNMGGAPVTPLHTLASADPDQQKAYEQWQRKAAELADRQKEVNNQLKKLRPRGKNKGGKKQPEAKNDRLAKLNAERQELAEQLKALRGKPVQAPGVAMGMRDAGKITEVPIYVRGESAKGPAIGRRLLTVMAEPPAFPANQSGRLELARWLASADNPLTARVMVNRVWLHLFGVGIVRTPDNFGINGDRPSHPKLLDHLAADFVADGWSVKRLIRKLVLTRAYRLADAYDDRAYNIDPDNIYLWRHSRRRLDAEEIRDAILTVSGKLELTPPEGSVVTAHGGKLIQDALTPDKIHQPSNQRSVYLAILRNGLPEALEVFDMADPSLVVGKRSVTTVPAQDLFLMNSPFVVEQAKAFAQRVLADAGDDDKRIESAYRRALARAPSAAETQRALKFLQETTKALADQRTDADKQQAAWTGLCQALFLSAEFRHLR